MNYKGTGNNKQAFDIQDDHRSLQSCTRHLFPRSQISVELHKLIDAFTLMFSRIFFEMVSQTGKTYIHKKIAKQQTQNEIHLATLFVFIYFHLISIESLLVV